MGYRGIYKLSMDDPQGFWANAAEELVWEKKWDQVLDDSTAPFYHWFNGGRLNTCYNAVDRHVNEGRAEQVAVIYDSPVTDTRQTYTFLELQDEVARLAGVLKSQSIEKGDRVLIYMPMIPQAIFAMLACARIGAVHSVVFGGFAAAELATRIEDAQPKIVLSASCGIEVTRVIEYKPLLDQAINLSSHKPAHTIIFQRPQAAASMQDGRDLDWISACEQAEPVDCVSLAATDPLYILYTSGTTGVPKGVVRDNGGHAVAMLWSMRNVYNVKPGEVFWAASDVGWVVGHSYIVYGPLLNGNTTVLYEGKPVFTPDAGAFWRVIEEHKVSVMFTAPTAFRAIKKEDPKGEYCKKYNLKNFRALFLAGERCDPPTLSWAEELLNVPVIDHWWQTETAWAIAANCLGIEALPVKPGSPSCAVPGYQVDILNDKGEVVAEDEIGSIMIKLPMPPGCLPTLWNDDERFVKSYLSTHPGYYLTGDAGYKDEDGYIWVMSRIDDIINVAGHRLSTGAIEEVIAAHPDVAECAVIGVADELKGEVPLGLMVLKSGVERDMSVIAGEVIALVREKIGAVCSFKKVVSVAILPKTRSGKILRGTMKKIADCESYKMPATIDDPAILDEIKIALKSIGYA
ncbi:MAG: propionyl-CoA synthetase [gamma proteobacterium symbiont of Taylorina sp.]|nr:propionyl-CoA synthetase [gamma proteobacterium symbiont of Taylorina sp.]